MKLFKLNLKRLKLLKRKKLSKPLKMSLQKKKPRKSNKKKVSLLIAVNFLLIAVRQLFAKRNPIRLISRRARHIIIAHVANHKTNHSVMALMKELNSSLLNLCLKVMLQIPMKSRRNHFAVASITKLKVEPSVMEATKTLLIGDQLHFSITYERIHI